METVQEEEVASSGPLVSPTTTLTLRDKRWYYKGEGNVNVVLAVPSDGTVVRVMKDDGSTAETAAAALSVLVRYRDAVGRLFFAGCDYTDVPVPMAMSADELQDIDQRVRHRRPPNRRHKGFGWSGGLVAVCPDYTVLPAVPGPVYCVELKPKQGWLHEADRAARGDGARCAFCAHQYLKLARGDVREISRYCPLDLFSGRRGRVRRAIRRLFRTPQNNLKVFVGGEPVDERDFGRAAREAFGDVRRLSAFVAAVLLGRGCDRGDDGEDRGDDDGEDREDDDGEDREVDDGEDEAGRPPCDYNAVPMPEHCVLHKVLTMLKMQTTGFAAVCSAYNELPQIRLAAPFGHVDRLSVASVASPVDGYLVAATAQDCSVFVTFSRADCAAVATVAVRPSRGVRFGDRRYVVRVKVSDLDPKPLSTVEKHRKRNADVLLACKQHLDRGRNA